MTPDCGAIEWDDRPGGRWVEVEPDRLRMDDFVSVVAVVDNADSVPRAGGER